MDSSEQALIPLFSLEGTILEECCYRYPRLYRRGSQLITSGARPAPQDLGLTPA